MEGNYENLRETWLSSVNYEKYIEICDRICTDPRSLKSSKSRTNADKTKDFIKIFVSDTYYGYGFETEVYEIADITIHRDNHTDETLAACHGSLSGILRAYVTTALAYPILVAKKDLEDKRVEVCSKRVTLERVPFFVRRDLFLCDITIYYQTVVQIA